MNLKDHPQAVRRRVAEVAIEALERRYIETKNPLFVFEAIARREGIAPPKWVMQYLDTAAKALFELVGEAREQKLGRLPDRISKALAMKRPQGKDDIFKEYLADLWSWPEWFNTGAAVAAMTRGETPMTLTDAITAVAREFDYQLVEGKPEPGGDLQVSKVKRAWAKFERQFPDWKVNKSSFW